MSTDRKCSRRVLGTAVLVMVVGVWCGAPLEAGPGVASAPDGGWSLVQVLPDWLAQWLGFADSSGPRSLSAAGGAGMDPNGAPKEEEPAVEPQGGAGLDPNG